MEPISVPLWLNIASMVVGLVVIVAMAKWVARGERKRNEIEAKNKG